MKRRDFLKTSTGLLFAVPAINVLSSIAFAKSEQEVKAELMAKQKGNNCHKNDFNETEIAMKEANPALESGGIWLISMGCKSPHKHLAYVPLQYIQNTDLIPAEGLSIETSHSFDRDAGVVLNDAISNASNFFKGRHNHTLKFSKSELISCIQNPAMIEKIAMQPTFSSKFTGGIITGEEAGHVFVMKPS